MVEKSNRLIYLDSSVLIDYFRKGIKSNSFLEQLLVNIIPFLFQLLPNMKTIQVQLLSKKSFGMTSLSILS